MSAEKESPTPARSVHRLARARLACSPYAQEAVHERLADTIKTVCA
jgi:hypothetical protein